MRSLLDVNVLIALLDADHSLHLSAIQWFEGAGKSGWNSCPITQNGCVRIMSHPHYPNAFPVSVLVERLSRACSSKFHDFWPDDVSILNDGTVDAKRVHGPRQLTDIYLLALAVRHDGRFVTFDGSVALDAVHGARKQHLLTL